MQQQAGGHEYTQAPMPAAVQGLQPLASHPLLGSLVDTGNRLPTTVCNASAGVRVSGHWTGIAVLISLRL